MKTIRFGTLALLSSGLLLSMNLMASSPTTIEAKPEQAHPDFDWKHSPKKHPDFDWRHPPKKGNAIKSTTEETKEKTTPLKSTQEEAN